MVVDPPINVSEYVHKFLFFIFSLMACFLQWQLSMTSCWPTFLMALIFQSPFEVDHPVLRSMKMTQKSSRNFRSYPWPTIKDQDPQALLYIPLTHVSCSTLHGIHNSKTKMHMSWLQQASMYRCLFDQNSNFCFVVSTCHVQVLFCTTSNLSISHMLIISSMCQKEAWVLLWT